MSSGQIRKILVEAYQARFWVVLASLELEPFGEHLEEGLHRKWPNACWLGGLKLTSKAESHLRPESKVAQWAGEGSRAYWDKRRRAIGPDKIDRHLDLRGKGCPDTALEPLSALSEMAVGEVLEVVTDFYPARQTIPQRMRELGYSYVLVDGDKPVFGFLIRKG